ncbi:MAG: hypothetical protein KKB21_04970 [Nanoarchaeota archaeon]|nr:hypothetical protein [Nanoarchaeota archaeon]MBU4086898.1 hypothetical protein [Nanoarchaeota archaeon]
MIVLIIALMLATSFPVGYLLAYLCKEELVNGRRWFKLISWLSAGLILGLLVFYRDFSVILTLAYICIVSLISVHKSFDKKFVK